MYGYVFYEYVTPLMNCPCACIEAKMLIDSTEICLPLENLLSDFKVMNYQILYINFKCKDMNLLRFSLQRTYPFMIRHIGVLGLNSVLFI